MRLVTVSYTEFEGGDQEWSLDRLDLGASNLLVGRNATGKSRCLNVIGGVARCLTGRRAIGPFPEDCAATFSHDDGTEVVYHYRFDKGAVLLEHLAVGGRTLLHRDGKNGEGRIFAVQLGDELPFQAPVNELAAVARRDAIQHPFLQPLHDWASRVHQYYFGTSLGKENFVVIVPKGMAEATEADERDAGRIVGVYRKALKEVGEQRFKEAMLADLERVDYPATDIGVGPPVSVQFLEGMPGQVVSLWVKEKGLRATTDQNSMSQGMFRVLALLTLSNYLMLTGKTGCLLIDDIGEGLDFDRAYRLIDVLRDKAKRSAVQLIASTNDKFVMNQVPLEEWSVLQRQGSRVRALTQANSPQLFEAFKFTGLSNFSFLELDFANAPPVEASTPP